MIAILKSPMLWGALAMAGWSWLIHGIGASGVQTEWELAKTQSALAATQQALTHQREINKRDARISALSDELEIAHAKRKAEVDRILVDNRRLARELGGLRDPGRVPVPEPTRVPAATEPIADRGRGSCSDRLSDAASEFLLEFAAQCDAVVGQYETLREWALKIPDAGRVSGPQNQ